MQPLRAACDPALITIKTGAKVRWINAADVYHTITSTNSFEDLTPNEHFNHVFFKKK